MNKLEEHEELRRRAALGEARAQLQLAWEYAKGEIVPKNIDTAIGLLGQMESKAPQLARFNIAKIRYLEGDYRSFVEELRQDCAAGFGPALYLMGVYSKRKVGGDEGLREAIRYYRAAAQNGHLPSEFLVWRLGKLGLWQRFATAIPAHRTFMRLIAIRWRDEDDIRVLT
jgi:TPR repeat protein